MNIRSIINQLRRFPLTWQLSWRIILTVILILASFHAWSQNIKSQLADYILAIVNQEVITAAEVQQRLNQFVDNAQQAGEQTPAPEQLHKQILDNLIDERAMLSLARDTGIKVEEHEVQRSINYIASQNQITVPELQLKVTQAGTDYKRFVANIQDQMLIERYREREVVRRIDVSDADIEAYIQKIQGNKPTPPQIYFNIAQILVSTPENAPANNIKKNELKAKNILEKAIQGVPFADLAAQFSDDKSLPPSGEMGLKESEQIPEIFLSRINHLQSGQVLPELVRSPAGFHIIKVVQKQISSAIPVPQTWVKHILLRSTDASKRQAAIQSLMQMRAQIIRGSRTFESFAREYSQDGSAATGGDLGWAGPGMFVPEFEQAMNKLPKGGISGPVVSRFGVHLIHVVDRRQEFIERKSLYEKSRAILRQEKYEETYRLWLKEIRNRVYIELRDAPTL